MLRRDEYKQYPICDTDIWVYACLGGIEDKLISTYGKLVMADVVVQEINGWNKEDYKYDYIHKKFQKYARSGQIIVIHHTDIPENEKQVLELNLYSYGFSNGFENLPKEEHKGEIVSAMYADNFNIPILASNDNAFKEGGDAFEEFGHLTVYDWNKIAKIVTKNDKERIKLIVNVDRQQIAMKKCSNN